MPLWTSPGDTHGAATPVAFTAHGEGMLALSVRSPSRWGSQHRPRSPCHIKGFRRMGRPTYCAAFRAAFTMGMRSEDAGTKDPG